MREAVGIRVWNVFYEHRASNVRRMRAAILLFCAAALVAGCGDDDEETTVVETTTTTTIETVPAPGEPDVTTPDDMGERVEPSDESEGGNGAVEAPHKCGRIAFNPSTDSGAAGITAAGTDCETARAVARAARNATDELSYEAESFRCTGARSEKAGLSSIEWFCVGAEREVVTFVTT
jgi:hypothetical protein